MGISHSGYYSTPEKACAAFLGNIAPDMVGTSLGAGQIITRVDYRYVAPNTDISPPGQCRIRTFVSAYGGPEYFHGDDKYFFTHRGRFYITFSPLRGKLGRAPLRKNSAERNNDFVGEPVDVTDGNIYHSETLAVGNGSRVLRLRLYYNSLDGGAGPMGARWRHGFGRSIDTPAADGARPAPQAPFFKSHVYDTAKQACSGGWADVVMSLDDPWIEGTHASLDAATNQCVIYRAFGSGVVAQTPIYSDITGRAYYRGSAPIPRVTLHRPDGARYELHRSDGLWVDNKGIPARLRELTDADGTRSGWRYTTDERTVETYDAAGRLSSVRRIDGVTTTVTYGGAGRIERIGNDAAYSLSFGYDDHGRIRAITDNTNRIWSFSHDALDNLVEIERPDGSSLRFRYGDARFPHALTGIRDARGVEYIHYAYDDKGRAVLSTLAGGAGRVDIAYNDASRTRTVTDGDGAQTTYHLRTQNGVRLVTRVDGPACPRCGNGHYQAKFDPATNALQSETRNGVTTVYGDYDDKGNPGYRIEAAGTERARRTDYTYDARFLEGITSQTTASVAAGKQRVVQYRYDDYGHVIRKTISGFTQDGAGRSRTTTYAYDGPFHQLSRVDGPRTDIADVATYTYNAKGNLERVTDALGHVTVIDDHDTLGRPLTITGPNGLVTHLAYDVLGRLVSRDAGGRITSFQYDAAGDLTRVALPDGSYLAYSYDDARRLIGISDRLGNRIAYTLDSRGNRIEEDRYDPEGTVVRTRSRIYNDLNRLVRAIGAEGQATAYQYDGRGNLTGLTDPLAHAVARAFDALNRLVQATDALGGVTDYAYDSRDHITRVTDPDGHVTSYVYDDLGNRLAVDSPDSGVTHYGYDGAGNVIRKTDAGGNTTRYAYDALNRLLEVTYADGSAATYTYDIGVNGIGRLASVSDATGRISWAYDLHGRVNEKRQTVGDIRLSTRYVYDGYGRLSAMVYPSGNRVGYGYDVDGRVVDIAINGEPVVTNVSYRPFGPVKGWTWGNGTPHHRRYDLDGRLTNVSLPGGTRTLSYDLAGRVTALTDRHHAMTFEYDAANRLTRAEGGLAEQSFRYDPNGNRTKLIQDAAATSYVYAPGSNRLKAVDGPLPRDYRYDPNGSIIADGIHTYAYDARNRLVSVDGGADTYDINALGQRVGKTVTIADPPGDADSDGTIDYGDLTAVLNVILQTTTPSGKPDCNRDNAVDVQDLVCVNTASFAENGSGRIETAFLYGEQGGLIGEYRANGIPIGEIVFLGGLPVALIQSHRLYYIYPGYLGSTRTVTDPANTVVWRWVGSPFGKGRPEADPDGDGVSFTFNRRLAGQYFDSETGLHYNYFRSYDPAIGRYVRPDALGLAAGMNVYSYAFQNPLGFSDPRGRIIGALAACAFNPVCAGAVRAGVGAVIGGLSAFVEAANDPCFKGSLAQAALRGAGIGAITGLVPGEGAMVGAFARGAASGFAGNTAGQLMSRGGTDNFSVWKAVSAGAVGGVSLAIGNAVGLGAALAAVRSPAATAAQALANGESVGAATSTAIAASVSLIQEEKHRRKTARKCACN